MGVLIDIRGIPEVSAALNQLDVNARQTLQKATTAGAHALKPFVQAAAPRGATGNLRRKVSARMASRNRPASIVKPTAFYAHMVIGGTKDHGPRTASVLSFTPGSNGYSGNTRIAGHGTVIARHVRGTKPRPFVDEGFNRGRAAMETAIDLVIEEALTGVGK